MKYIIQKFGGTSLGTASRITEATSIVIQWARSYRVVVTVSAINSYNKKEGTTNKLLEAKKLAENQGPYIKVIDEIEENHLSIAHEMLKDPKIHSFVEEQIKRIIKKLKAFLSAVEIIHETSPKIEDVIIGTGEKLSALLFSSVLNQQGLDAEYIDLSDVVSVKKNGFEEADSAYYDFLKDILRDRITNAAGVPILTGFFGEIPRGILSAVGRGYTDLTASLAAAAVDAEELQIWKEVNGIYSADPNKVKTARVISSVTPSEAAELTYYGSEVINPTTVEQAIKCRIPIRIKNTFHPELPGTIIDPTTDDSGKKNGPTAVTSKTGIQVLNVNSNRMQNSYGFMQQVFDVLSKHKISVDLISTSEVSISLTIDHKYDQEIKDAIPDLEKLGKVSLKYGQAIISLIGEGMKSTVGTAHRFFAALAEKKINIEMISQGASEINISCVIESNSVFDALNEIHRTILE